jgi:hypothetical protein
MLHRWRLVTQLRRHRWLAGTTTRCIEVVYRFEFVQPVLCCRVERFKRGVHVSVQRVAAATRHLDAVQDRGRGRPLLE